MCCTTGSWGLSNSTLLSPVPHPKATGAGPCKALVLGQQVFTPFHLVLSSFIWASLVAQMVKRLPTMQETWVRSLGQEDPLGKELATHSSVLAWKIPWTEEPGRLPFMGMQRVGHD